MPNEHIELIIIGANVVMFTIGYFLGKATGWHKGFYKGYSSRDKGEG